MKGEVTSLIDLQAAKFVDRYVIGPTTGADGFDGATAWQQDISGVVVPEEGGDARQLAVNEAYRDANLWWHTDRDGARIETDGCRSIEGRTYAVLTVTPRGGKPFEAWFGMTSHLLARTVEAQGFEKITTRFDSYGPVSGAVLPRRIIIDDGSGPANLQRLSLASARFENRALATYGPPTVHLTDYSIGAHAVRTAVPFELCNNHVFAHVWIDGKGPFRFLFDTGGHDIVTPALAKRLGLHRVGNVESHGAGTASATGGYVQIRDVRLADAHLRNQTFLVLRFEPNAVEGFPVDGMLGFETFARFVVRIDYGRRMLTLFDPGRFRPPTHATAVPFVFYNSIPEVDGAFDGIAGTFDIDTGSRSSVDLTKPFVDAHKLRARYPDGVLAVTGWGVGGPVRSYVIRAGSLELGSERVANVVADLTTQSGGSFADPSYAGNVGNGTLKRFTVTFDYRNRTLYFERRQPASADAGTYDRSGMWINQAGPSFRVADLTAGGPAQSAGLRVGDLIVAVAGTPSSSITLSDLRKRLRDAPQGTVVRLRVRRRAATRRIALALRDQIPPPKLSFPGRERLRR